ncbi:MAG: hypothetical protein HY355_07500 [Armatimonadetes bacterium]|nr:hypothetical protein [Armatimonadota bacterium]
MTARLVLVLVIVAVVAGATVEAAPSVPAATPQPKQAADGLGRLRADRIRYDARQQVFVATGNVVLALGDLEIRADGLRLEQPSQTATAEGRVVVRQGERSLTAPVVRYEFRTETAEAAGGAVLVQSGTTIKAPTIRFLLRDEVTQASGGVEVIHGEAAVTAPTLRHEGRTGEVSAAGGVTLTQPGTRISGRRLIANLRARRAEVREDATLVRAAGPPADRPGGVADALAKEETTITAARIAFRWDVNEAEAYESVVVRQRDKTAWADRLSYSEPANRLVLTGRVVLEQTSGEWLVREGLTSPPREATERQALAALTRLTCTRLIMTLRERDITAEGPLRVTQKDRWATGDRATYTEATRLLVVTGNVHVQEADGRRLQADRVVISLADETFEAEGNVRTEFVVRPSPTRRP